MSSPSTSSTAALKPTLLKLPGLKRKLQNLDTNFPDQFGVYVKDLDSGEEFSWRGQETWYIASGVKLPIAIETLRQVDRGELSLNTKIILSESDYVDGSGFTNKHKPGDQLTVRYLLKQMMIHSDNTASDLLIKTVGLENIQKLLAELNLKGFTKLTTLADVRRHAYSYLNPQARMLQGRDFLFIKSGNNEKEKILRIQKVLKSPGTDPNITWDEAFKKYYEEKINSATLEDYGKLLETLITGDLLKPSTRAYLLKVMADAETGKNRIKAGFPKDIVFAHKTGTQHARVCDFGVVFNPRSRTGHPVIVAACTRGITSTEKAEEVLKKLGKTLWDSGVFYERPKIASR